MNKKLPDVRQNRFARPKIAFSLERRSPPEGFLAALSLLVRNEFIKREVSPQSGPTRLVWRHC